MHRVGRMVSLPPEVSSADVRLAQLHLPLWQDWKQLRINICSTSRSEKDNGSNYALPASRAVTTAGARRFAPSKSILIRLEELRRMEARHSDTTLEKI